MTLNTSPTRAQDDGAELATTSRRAMPLRMLALVSLVAGVSAAALAWSVPSALARLDAAARTHQAATLLEAHSGANGQKWLSTLQQRARTALPAHEDPRTVATIIAVADRAGAREVRAVAGPAQERALPSGESLVRHQYTLTVTADPAIVGRVTAQLVAVDRLIIPDRITRGSDGQYAIALSTYTGGPNDPQ